MISMPRIGLQHKHSLAVVLTSLILLAAPILRAQEAPESSAPPDQAPEADPIPAMFPYPETDRWWISGQANVISQWHPAFHSPYDGRNSLSAQAQDATSHVFTLYTGLPLSKAPYIARLMWHQIIPLSSEDAPSVRTPLSLFSRLPVRRLEIRFGKLGLADFFDFNTYGTDSNFQFLNWTVDNSGAYDY